MTTHPNAAALDALDESTGVAALGNTIDPELAEAIIRRIKEVEDESNNIP